MNLPKIITHTHISIDGKINGKHLGTEASEASQIEFYKLFLGANPYYNNHKGWLCGTSTSELITNHQKPELGPSITSVPEGDYIAKPDAEMYYFTTDTHGRLGWQSNEYTYFDTTTHVVEILTENTSPAFKQFLRQKEISYIVAGKESIDLKLAAQKIKENFDIEELIVSGGGAINWSFLSEGLVDEISLVVTPIADGSPNSQSLFASNEKYNMTDPINVKLEHVETLDDGSLWIRYQPLNR